MSAIVDRDARVREILDDATRRRAAGETLTDEALLAAHPDLASELREALRRLKLIARARAVAEEAPPESKASGLVSVRCPHCERAMVAPSASTVDEIRCTTCGRFIHLDDEEDVRPHRPRWIAHYELIRPLGEGGFGEVWEAHDTRLDRHVAIKLPRGGTMSQRDAQLFGREARAAAQLRHPNIVAVFEIGQLDKQCYIVSELVHGQPLSSWVSARGPNSYQAARLFVIIAQAVEHAHRAGVIHRDLKPANVLIDAADEPHLVDFGLAKRESGEATMTIDGQMLGTVAYMSPEQARGTAHQCTATSDVYSLGVMLFELLTGELPFRGSPTALLQQIVQEEPPNPRRFRSDVPRELETICLKCLEKDPARRYQSAAALADDLGRFTRGEPILARPVGPVERAGRWCRRNRAVASLAAAVLVTLTVGASAATYFALRANSALRDSVAATRQAVHERELAQRGAYNTQVARASAYAVYAPREALALLHDAELCPPHRREFVWRYMAELSRREHRVLSGHTDHVSHVVFSPDGKLLATAGRDGTIHVWNTADWSARHVLRGHQGWIHGLAFCGQEPMLFSAGADWTVRRWNPNSGESLGVVAKETSPVQCLAASSDGQQIAWATSGVLFWGDGVLSRIMLCDASTLGVRKRLVGHTDAVASLAFSPDSEYLVSGSCKRDTTVRIWNARSGETAAVLKGHTATVGSLGFFPDGKTLVTGGERLRFWSFPEGNPKPSFAHNPPLGVNTLAIAPGGLTIALGYWAPDIAVIDLATGGHVRTLPGPETCGVFSLAYSRDGKLLASGGSDPLVRIWDVVHGTHQAQELIHPSDRIVALAATPDESLVAALSRDAKLALWQPATGNLLRAWSVGHGVAHALAMSSDGQHVFTSGQDGVIRRWATGNGQLEGAWQAHFGPTHALALSPDRRTLASAGHDGRVIWWDCETSQRQKTFERLPSPVHCLGFAANGAMAAGMKDGRLWLWRSSQQLPVSLQAHTAAVNSLAFYPDGAHLVTGSDDHLAKLWRLDSLACQAHLRSHVKEVHSVAIAPDGRTLAVTGYKVSLRDPLTGQERCQLEDPTGLTWCSLFGTRGSLISGHDRGVVRIRRADVNGE